jgi:hypothetical protein
MMTAVADSPVVEDADMGVDGAAAAAVLEEIEEVQEDPRVMQCLCWCLAILGMGSVEGTLQVHIAAAVVPHALVGELEALHLQQLVRRDQRIR